MSMVRSEPKPYKPGVLITGRRLIIGVVAAVAVGSHAALGVWAWDKPIATVAEPGAADAQPVRIKRAAPDEYVFIPPTIEPEAVGPTAEELTKALLDSEPPSLIGDPLDIEFKPPAIDETASGSDSALEIKLPDFKIGDDVLSELDTRPKELEFGENGGGKNPGDGTGKGGGKGSAELASDALGNTEAAPVRMKQPAQPIISRPAIDGPKGVADAPPDTDPSTDPLDIDFTGVLGDTTELKFPENLDNDFLYRITRYDPTDRRGNRIDPAVEPGYFRVDISALRSLKKLKTIPKDVIFLIDTSSSISPKWVEQITDGVSQSLVSLNKGDRFNLVLFNEKVSLLSEDGPVDATEENKKAARGFLASAKSVGYTNVNAAIRKLLKRDVDNTRAYEIILISDGQSTRGVLDTRDLINLITKDNDLVASIYCVGVGRTQKRELLNFLAYRNKGFARYASKIDKASITIQNLMVDLRYPIITDVRLSAAGLDSTSLFPADLPNIHQGQTIQVFGRFKEADAFTLRLTGRSAGKDVEFTFKRDLAEADRGGKTVANEWAFWKLHDLYSLIIREGEKEELLDQIEALSDKYDLETLY